MAEIPMVTLDANEAVARVAFALNEVIAIYPITPASGMAELSEEWASLGKRNVLGSVPQIIEMQSEAGAAGSLHGALQAGALSTTFTASQGLLLMIPIMYKAAGELTPVVIHVAARTLATHALSIFGDHSDVMACRQTGFAMLCGSNVQEAQDMAAVSHIASLESRIPFLHFFDGFRTSHEVNKIAPLTQEQLRALLDDKTVAAHRSRSLTPDAPVIRGTAQNPDAFFQAREAANKFTDATPGIVEGVFKKFAALTGRQYGLLDYHGHPQATRVVVVMGSGAETVRETVTHLVEKGEAVGVITVRLYRPFPMEQLARVLPSTVKQIAVLDRTKEPGSTGDPMFLDVVAGLEEARAQGWVPETFRPNIVGGRYGLSSKEFTPAMVKAVYDQLSQAKPRRRFTVGIRDDVTHLSLSVDESFHLPMPGVVSALFYGMGSDGTVGSNKHTIKIIGEETENSAQGYFVYDSKKSGSATVSHLRFGRKPIRAPYLIEEANFIGVHYMGLLMSRGVLDRAAQGATVLLNAPWPVDKAWDEIPRAEQKIIIDRNLTVYAVDADGLSAKFELAGRISGILQTCFMALSGALPRDEAIACVRASVEKAYAKKGPDVVRKNLQMVDAALEHMHKITVGKTVTSKKDNTPVVSKNAPEFVQRVTAMMLAGKGDLLPVSAFPIDGTWASATSQYEKRTIAKDIPTWSADLCIQCNKCALVCPHAAIRTKVYEPELIKGAPASFVSRPFKSQEYGKVNYTVQVMPDDCTGCELCFEVCPAKDKGNPRIKALNMSPIHEVLEKERPAAEFFLNLPEMDRTKVKMDLKGSQLLQPLFEYSGACSGCGETPYIKLLTQLFGDRLMIANATGCSSIYGGNLPTTPYAVDKQGRGPAWANSLFEDNAEFGLGMSLGIDAQKDLAKILVTRMAPKLGQVLVDGLLKADQSGDKGIAEQRARVEELRKIIKGDPSVDARALEGVAQHLVKRSMWIVGGDGWAYDIGYGGLDHVLASGHNVNILVLDTEVYSNTGGQQSKSTPLGASAKFAATGKTTAKKDLIMMAVAYGTAYVARVAMGAKDAHTVKAFMEAESFNGPSIIIAYSHCIAHGYDLTLGLNQQKLAVQSGVWPLMRFDPRRAEAGENPLQMDSDNPTVRVKDYMQAEGRFQVARAADPDRYLAMTKQAQLQVEHRLAQYRHLATLPFNKTNS